MERSRRNDEDMVGKGERLFLPLFIFMCSLPHRFPLWFYPNSKEHQKSRIAHRLEHVSLL